jgi:hypothetical protein
VRPQSIPPNARIPVPQARPQSTPAVPIHGMHAQQPLPGFQQVQQQHPVAHPEQQQLHGVVHQAQLAQRLQNLQFETQRLQREMGAIHRAAQMAASAMGNGQQAAPMPNPLAAPQGMFQVPHLGHRPPQAIPPSVQNLIAQQQRDRAAEGRNGAQDAPGNGIPGLARPSVSGRASPSVHRPDHTTTVTREGVGPNGERWQVTVNETTTTLPMPQPHHHLAGHHHHMPANPALDIQALLRNADRYLAAQNNQAARNNMQRSASNPPPSTSTQAGPSIQATAATQPNTPGVATPPTGSGSPSASTIMNPPLQANSQAANTTNNSTPSEPMVYILSSAQGPRALLVSNSDTFFTPRQSSRRHRVETPAPNQAQAQGQPGEPIGLPEYRNRPANRAVRRGQRNVHQLEPVNEPHGNPPEGALAARIGPAIWLAIRLIGVVWLFTSGNTTWTRWFLFSAIAFLIFLVNTGMLNGFGDQLWGPIRRHVENLIPLAGPEAALVPAANAAIPQPAAAPEAPAAGNEQAPRATNGEPNPAQVAARLLEERRQQNGGWLLAQVRRAEHALLLFLASLVPGVGERHIAHREAEANAAEAERQRRIDEAAAAAATPPEGTGEGTGEEASAEGQSTSAGESQPAQAEQPPNEQGAAAPPHLVEV